MDTFHHGSRVRITKGEHEGKEGTVNHREFTSSMGMWYGVRLDGEVDVRDFGWDHVVAVPPPQPGVFAIEFQANMWDAGVDGADRNNERLTYRVLVDPTGARAFVAATEGFGGWSRVDGDQPAFRRKAPLSEIQIISQALRGYHGWWTSRHRAPRGMEPGTMIPPPAGWGEQLENGVPIFNIGTLKDSPTEPPKVGNVPALSGAQERIAELEGELRVRDEQLEAARARIEAYDQQFLAYGRSVGVLEETHGELVKALTSDMAGLGVPGTSVERFGLVPAIKALADHVRRRSFGASQSALVRVATGIGVSDLTAEPEKVADTCLKIISHERELHRAVCGDLKGCSDALRGIMCELGVTVPRPSSADGWTKDVRTTIIEAIDRIKEKRQRAPLDAIKEAEEFVRFRLAKIVGDKDASLDRCAWIFERVAQELRNEASSWPNRFGVNAPLDGIAINFISDYRVMTTRHDFLERSNTEVRKLVGADSDPMTDTVAAVRDALKQGRDAAGVTAAIVRLAEAQERGLAYLQETTEILKRVHGEG